MTVACKPPAVCHCLPHTVSILLYLYMPVYGFGAFHLLLKQFTILPKTITIRQWQPQYFDIDQVTGARMNYTEFISNYHNYCPFANSLGLRLTDMRDGHVEGEIPITPALFNPIGSIHGGVYYTLADTVGGCAARTRGQIPTTIEGKLNHIRAATSKDKKLIGKADVIHFGQKTIVTSVEISNDSGQTLSVGLFTFFALDKSDLKAWL